MFCKDIKIEQKKKKKPPIVKAKTEENEEKGGGDGDGEEGAGLNADEKENSVEHLKNVLESIEEKTQRPPHLTMVLSYTISISFSRFINININTYKYTLYQYLSMKKPKSRMPDIHKTGVKLKFDSKLFSYAGNIGRSQYIQYLYYKKYL